MFVVRCHQYEEGKKRKKPNYSSVDLSEVEWEDKEDVVSAAPHSSAHSTSAPGLLTAPIDATAFYKHTHIRMSQQLAMF